MLTLTQNSLPKEVNRLSQPPKKLFVDGELESLMARPRIGIVGSRKASPYGRAVTTKLTHELARGGAVIVSGLALGTDSIAHTSCLQAGGNTLAVLPCGLDDIYPRSHTTLARQIVGQGGGLVTEYPVGSAPRREHFIARNRIIAALSEGLLIPEAAVNSGSLHTARFALELGIPVMAVPGPITSPTSEGTNNLIKAGAVPVTCVEDIYAALSWKVPRVGEAVTHAASEPERRIMELLRTGVSDGHELLLASELPAPQFNQALTMLEITGRVRPLGNNHWSLA